MKKYLSIILAVVAVPVFADVTFDPSTGIGSVGKGDIQTQLFDGNDDDLQANAGDVTFSYESGGTYKVVVEWYTGPAHNRKRHTECLEITTGVSGSVNHEVKTNPQGKITGFDLTGFGDDLVVTDEEIPEVGQQVNSSDNVPKIIISVELEDGSTGGLYAHYGDVSVLLQ